MTMSVIDPEEPTPQLPEGEAPFPLVVFVHGDGPIDRTSFGMYLPLLERMLRAGYATFAWDKPGTGESTGQIDRKDQADDEMQCKRISSEGDHLLRVCVLVP